ncbi:hypothetical protein [Polaromonas sp. Pch-P]|uniref:hypothetical protein n=1 Tax=Polaromonas sp. Pch-P TaxID=2082385 RepID=UPI00129E3E8F|nr:hypothetical protein [Polaromonas sp. Pch-P]QGJ20341.1 hypothetical protein F7R28_19370 [Polaromonas sp. Pch-P]
MSITPTDLLGLAAQLAAASDATEVSYRGAVSRAYYAAYHDSDVWHSQLPVPGFLPAQFAGGMHSQLCHRLANPDATLHADRKVRSKQRGYVLKVLHALRICSDYELSEVVGAEDSQQAISDAQKIIALN